MSEIETFDPGEIVHLWRHPADGVPREGRGSLCGRVLWDRWHKTPDEGERYRPCAECAPIAGGERARRGGLMQDPPTEAITAYRPYWMPEYLRGTVAADGTARQERDSEGGSR